MGAVEAADPPREPRGARGDPSISTVVCSCGVCALGVMLSAVPDGVDKTGEANRELALTWFDLVGEADGVIVRRGVGVPDPVGSGRLKGERRVDANPPPIEGDLVWLAGRAWVEMAR